MSELHRYGARSIAKLSTCHVDLERVMEHALDLCPFDIIIVCGIRTKEAQEEAFSKGLSKKHWPNSKHNSLDGKSRAVDIAPWINGTINWKDEGSFYMLAGVVHAAAAVQGVQIRFGGDWNRDGLTEDQTFMDIGHFELV